jgi:hypothetical protein
MYPIHVFSLADSCWHHLPTPLIMAITGEGVTTPQSILVQNPGYIPQMAYIYNLGILILLPSGAKFATKIWRNS